MRMTCYLDCVKRAKGGTDTVGTFLGANEFILLEARGEPARS